MKKALQIFRPGKADGPYTRGEEIGHAVTHGVGVLLALNALALLIVKGALFTGALGITAGAIFGSTMVLLYLSSTLNHALTHKRAKEFFHLMDQVSIYFLIAGTYTPYVLVAIGGWLGWSIFGMEWGLALLGLFLKIFMPETFDERTSKASALFYVLMGWVIVFAVPQLRMNVATPGLWLLGAGGFSYTAGTWFFNRDRIPWFHFVWHFFVLGGSVCHFLSIFLYVLI